MSLLQNLLTEIVEEVIVDIETNHLLYGFDIAFSKYYELLSSSLKRYRHHLNDNQIQLNKLRIRFKFETAFLHILTLLASNVFYLSKGIEAYNWPVSDYELGFNWFPVSEKLQKRIYEVSQKLNNEPGRLEDLLSEIIFDVLSHAGRRYVGEYYTPLPLAKHLIQLTSFQPEKILQGCTVIDPACGGGIILTEIAHITVDHALHSKLSPEETLNCLKHGLIGYDIQPFAIVLTRTLLIYTCLPLISQREKVWLDEWFSQVKLADPLADLKKIVRSGMQFDFIIGNPPYLSVKREFLDFVSDYADVLYGHPNLFQLFLWWAVATAKPQGHISFLIPQSILIGPYFQRLREQLDTHTSIESITRLLDRKGIVGDADQQMMAICLIRKNGKLGDKESISVRVTQNGHDTLSTNPTPIKYSNVVQKLNRGIFWVVSDNLLDYEIAEHLEQSSNKLIDAKDLFIYGNGEYVWNQQKPLLRFRHDSSSVPLVSAASINLYRFIFPYTGSHNTASRQFSEISSQVSDILHVDSSVLIQRTTPRKVGRRLISCLIPKSFCNTYGSYFLENHVIYVTSPHQNLLSGLVGWLNSDLVNFVFQLRNGTAHTSVSEIELLPINLSIISAISQLSERIITSEPIDSSCITELNEVIFSYTNLSTKHRKRIAEVLNRTESRKKLLNNLSSSE